MLTYLYFIYKEEVLPSSGKNRLKWTKYQSQILKERLEKTTYLANEETQQLANSLYCSKRQIQLNLAGMRYRKRLKGLLPKCELS